jgi:hypothetical protein
MARDAYVGWGDYVPSGGKVYTAGAALVLCGNVSALVFMVLVLGWLLLSRKQQGFQAVKWGAWLALVAVAAGLLVYFLGVTKVGGSSFRTTRLRFGGPRNDCFELAVALGDELEDSNVVSGVVTPARPLTPHEQERLLQAVAHDFQGHWSQYYGRRSPLTNLFTGEAIRLEASPGNVVLRPAVPPGSGDYKPASGAGADAYELIWHDLDGAEAITNLVPTWQRH